MDSGEGSFQNTKPNLDFYDFLKNVKPNHTRIITEEIIHNSVF